MIRNQSVGAQEPGARGGGQGVPQRGVHLTTSPLVYRDSNRSAPRVQVAGPGRMEEVLRAEEETTTTKTNNNIKGKVNTKMTGGTTKTGIIKTGIITEIKNRITGAIDRIVTKRTGGIKKIKEIKGIKRIKKIKEDRDRIIKMTMSIVIGNHMMIEIHIKTIEIEGKIIMKVPGTRIGGTIMMNGRTFPGGKDRAQAGGMGIKDIKRTMMRGGLGVTGAKVRVKIIRGVGKVKDNTKTMSTSQGQKGLVLPQVADIRTQNRNHIKQPIRIKVNLKDSLKVKVTSQNLEEEGRNQVTQVSSSSRRSQRAGVAMTSHSPVNRINSLERNLCFTHRVTVLTRRPRRVWTTRSRLQHRRNNIHTTNLHR